MTLDNVANAIELINTDIIEAEIQALQRHQTSALAQSVLSQSSDALSIDAVAAEIQGLQRHQAPSLAQSVLS